MAIAIGSFTDAFTRYRRSISPAPSTPTTTKPQTTITPVPTTKPQTTGTSPPTFAGAGPALDPNVSFQGRDGTSTNVPESTLYGEGQQSVTQLKVKLTPGVIAISLILLIIVLLK